MKAKDYAALEGVTLQGQLVEFSKRSLVNRAYGSTFTACQIVLEPKGMPPFRGGARVLFAQDTMERCTIVAKGRVHDFDVTETTQLKACKFIGGPFTEPKFGSGTLSVSRDVELLEECDFTECDLRDARFYRTSIEQLALPGWPFITVVAQDGEALYSGPSDIRPAYTLLDDAVSIFQWDDRDMARSMEILVFAVGVGKNCPSVKVCHADDVVRRGAGSLDRLKAALDQFAHPAIRY